MENAITGAAQRFAELLEEHQAMRLHRRVQALLPLLGDEAASPEDGAQACAGLAAAAAELATELESGAALLRADQATTAAIAELLDPASANSLVGRATQRTVQHYTSASAEAKRSIAAAISGSGIVGRVVNAGDRSWLDAALTQCSQSVAAAAGKDMERAGKELVERIHKLRQRVAVKLEGSRGNDIEAGSQEFLAALLAERRASLRRALRRLTRLVEYQVYADALDRQGLAARRPDVDQAKGTIAVVGVLDATTQGVWEELSTELTTRVPPPASGLSMVFKRTQWLADVDAALGKIRQDLTERLTEELHRRFDGVYREFDQAIAPFQQSISRRTQLAEELAELQQLFSSASAT